MAALWGGGAGHAGAGGTLPLRGDAEPTMGSGLPSAQYLLAENLHLSLEAETILEAEELLGTMQDYLDSSVISIIEDFSSLTETKGRTDADNELSLLTAITEILDSTDDESLSPFDTIPDSELLTSPKEHDNSSFQRFLSLSRTPPKQDFCSIEDFEEPRICTIVTEKVEACATSLPLALTPNFPKDRAASKKANSKGPYGEWRVFRHREREPPTRQRSDGEEEEEEETTDCGQGFVAGVKEIPAALATKEVESDLPSSDGLYVISPESISLSELVRSMHPYCQPAVTMCLSPKSQPLAEKLVACPVLVEIAPDGRESMEVPVVPRNVETEVSCRTDSSSISGQTNKETHLLVPSLDKVSSTDNSKTAGLERDFALGSQAEGADAAVLQSREHAHLEAEEEARGSAEAEESTSQLGSGAPINRKHSASETDKRNSNTTKNEKKCSKKKRRHKEAKNGRPQKQTVSNPSNDEKQVEKAKGSGQAKPSPDQAFHAKEKLGTVKEELSKPEAELEPQSPQMPSLEGAEALPGIEERLSTQHQGDADMFPAAQESNQGSKPVSPTHEVVGPGPSLLLPSSMADIGREPPVSLLTSKESSCPPKEVKPRPLSLSEYRQRRLQRQLRDVSTSGTTEKQSASKWPSLPELPTELAELPCLVVPPPPPRPPMHEKPADTSSTPTPAATATASPPSLQTTAAPVLAPCFQNGTVGTSPLTVAAPVVPAQPSKAGAFPPVGAQVPSMLPPTYLPSAPGAFLPAPPSSYILGSLPPASPWAHFAPLPAGYKSMPPPPPATKACSAAFHTVPPVPPPTWPPPPVPLPAIGSGLPYNSIEWAAGPQPPYWPGIPVPPPMLPIPYGDQRVLLQSPPVGAFLTPSFSEETLGQQTIAPTLKSPHFRMQNLTAAEKEGLPAHLPWLEPPSTAEVAPRRLSDPRRQAQPCAVESKAQVTSNKSQPLEKLLFPPPVVEPLEKPVLPQLVRESSILSSSEESHSVLPSQEVKDSTGTLKSLEEPCFEPVEKAITLPATAQGAKETPPPAQSQEEPSPLPATLLPAKLTMLADVDTETQEAAPVVPSFPATAVPKKVQEVGMLSKAPTSAQKLQPIIGMAQCSRNKDVVRAFITEIGIEASDLSSLLEQFEKTEAKEGTCNVAKSKGSIAAENSSSEAQQEKKMVDRLQAPELTNVAGLTPPATPPHQLWKPLAAVSLLGKAGSPKGSRLAKSLGKPHRRVPAPLHVGSGEHDYCQLSAVPPKEGSRWNVKHSTEITIKPIKTLTKPEQDQPATNQPLAAAQMNPVGTLSMAAACQSPKEAPSPIDACQDKTQILSPAAASSSPARSEPPLLGSTLTRLHTEPLDHRTSVSRSVTRGSEGSSSVLLSPAASPCRDAEEPMLQQPQEVQQKRLASKRNLRCYRSRQKSTSPPKGSWKGRRNRASRSFSSSSDGDSDSSSSSSSSSSSTSSSSRSYSRSLSPPSKRWRRYRSRSSRSSSSSSAWSRSRSRSQSSSGSSYLSKSSSRSRSQHRRSSCRKRYDSSSSRDRYQRQKIQYKERAIEERRVVFIGKIPNRMTRSELRHRFSVFGDIEDCTLHFREQGDNYGFVTYRYAEEAFAAIDGGHALHHPDEQPFDLCFGGRRQFCKKNYADLDSNREDFEPAPMKNKFDSLDFDTLLKQAQRSLQR
ncbi:peroxisome proliferator-activated receptor gamma coactivator-related protein 1 [Eublepharis macularius]|uniref:Peroxisome proliferator-activated receptor gamma coactivator-related protein 1 n=1 Tax=Eublepharis macularius TaxID=481883 RepID=A0AA97JJS4_EUBMA|nr:peroxisome proliferator-activated receptor gamma coactivator-related protein 1 [Eublepharis macularius]